MNPAAWPLITEPAFFAVAVPAVLITGMSKAGFGSGFGALAVPLMALAVPVPQAAAIMLPLLAVMDALGLAAFVRHRDRALLRLLVPAGLLGTLLGTVLFGLISAQRVAAVVGVITLAFVAIRLFFPPSAGAAPPRPWLGFLLGTTSGFTSFVAHAGSPPVSFYVMPLRLAPATFTATMAVFFAVVNASKWVPYAWLGLFDARNLLTSLVLAPLAPVGVWLRIRLTRHMAPERFYAWVYAGMVATGLKLLWDGLR